MLILLQTSEGEAHQSILHVSYRPPRELQRSYGVPAHESLHGFFELAPCRQRRAQLPQPARRRKSGYPFPSGVFGEPRRSIGRR